MKAFIILAPILLLSCDRDPIPDPSEIEARAGASVPTPGPDGWGPGDELGNGNTQSYATRLRCAARLLDPQAAVYELGRVHSQTMPQALFGGPPVAIEYAPTGGLPFLAHVANEEQYVGSISQQGTQMDALGHFGVMPSIWDPTTDPLPPTETATYYNGFTQAQVKPAANGPLAALGIDRAPPIVTTAVILDVAELLGRPMEAGELVTAQMLTDAINAQIPFRRIRPGDAVYIRTGWGEHWADPEIAPGYYLGGPGLSFDAAQMLAASLPVLVGLDNPFTDPFELCQIDPVSPCPPPEGSPPGLPFAIHHTFLVEHGIYQIQNLDLTAIADDDVDVACTIVLPLRIRGGSGSLVRPVAIGR